MKVLFAAIAGAALMFGCAAAPTPDAPNVSITLERGVCFGFCPDYTVTIGGDGAVVYTGRRFVAVTGQQRAQVSPAEVQTLLRAFDAAHFTSLRDEYRANISDLPTYAVTLVRNGRTKRVVDYGGSSVGMPDAVRALEDQIDRVAGTESWVRRPDGKPIRQ